EHHHPRRRGGDPGPGPGPRRQEDRHHRPRQEGTHARVDAGRPGLHRHAGRHGLPDPQRGLVLAVRLPPHRPGRAQLRRARQLPHHPDRRAVLAAVRRDDGHHRRHRRHRVRPRVRAGARDAPRAVPAQERAHSDPGALRHHHGRLGVRLAVRLHAGVRVREPVVRHGPRLVRPDGPVAGRDLPVGDLEDDAVHVAAPARRSGADPLRLPGGGQGRRCHGLAALLQGHRAQHEERDHGRPALPHARRVPHLRQRLHHDAGRERHGDAELPRLPADDHARHDRARVRRQRDPGHPGGADRGAVHQGLQDEPGAAEGWL
ncbi:MAG: Maltodextrin ABC transporter, permease protein MdxF, partial [uncultured Frankineae bacterium]